MNRAIPQLLAILFLALCLSHCRDKVASPETKIIGLDNSASAKATKDAFSVAGNFQAPSNLKFSSSSIPGFFQKYPELKVYENDITRFYRERAYSYAWYNESGIIEQVNGLYSRILQMENDGLNTHIPYLANLHALMDDNDSSLLKEPMNPEAELLLTAQYFNFAKKVWQGVDEKNTKEIDWFLPRKKLDLKSLMDSLLFDGNKEFIATEPVYPQYGYLKNYLKTYRELQSKGLWKPIASDKRSYRSGDSSMVVVEIKKKLYYLGDHNGDTTKALFDGELEKGVKEFQRRHGWRDDGIVGAAMLQELNTPLESRIKQIVVNMERCRWVPSRAKSEFLLVNIPAYKLFVFENDSLKWDMNVVVGQTMHKTAIFNGDLKYVVFSPYWNVPPSILSKEILPGIKRDPNYLNKHNMEWNGSGVRQKPGPPNSLGKVKFLFPNSFNIYLHDTPAKSLFGEEQRAFSHGCIRLSEPEKLATYLLRNRPEWTTEKIKAAMNSGTEKYVTLNETVPVYIAYFTSWVDKNGKINFRNDVYKRDERVAKMILQ